MERVLRALEPARGRAGRIALVGHGWNCLPAWASPMGIEDIYHTDQDYLRKLRVEFVPPVPFREVIPWMSRAVLNPVIYRPLFKRLWMVTCRTFETPAASTIPLFDLETEYVRTLYGEDAVELVLPGEGGEEKIMDMLERPERYAEAVLGIRRHLAAKHSYRSRLQELVDLVWS
jgi:hypothetical protein